MGDQIAKRVMVDMSATLIHHGHIRLLKYAANLGSVVIGLATDQEVLNTKDVACVIDAKHLCVNSRGIKDTECSTITSEFGGAFKKAEVREELLKYIQLDTSFEDL